MSRHWTTPLTDQFADQLTHQVADGHAARADNGVRAICGRFITPAPLAAPVGKPCPACAADVAPPSRLEQPNGWALQPALRPSSRWLRALFAR
jgi:hypothetical protein